MRLYDVTIKSARYSAILLFMLFVIAPFLALAQTQCDQYCRVYWQEYYDDRAEIRALGSVASPILPIPILMKRSIEMQSNFGDPRGGGTRTHEGLDIAAVQGSPIASPTDAVVLAKGYGNDAGYFVMTVNPGREHLAYMHLSEIAKDIVPGVVIKRGDIIGFVGNTGNATSTYAHLHFEIRHNGPTDPWPRLKELFTLEERMKGVQQALEKTASSTEIAQMLVQNYRDVFEEARVKGIAIPAQIAALMDSAVNAAVPTAQAATPAAMTAAVSTGVVQSGTGVFKRDLEIGMQGEDVKALQKYLNANGYLLTTIGDGSPGYETLRFGALTRKALITFQKAKGISPAAGYFGPKTRAYITSH